MGGFSVASIVVWGKGWECSVLVTSVERLWRRPMYLPVELAPTPGSEHILGRAGNPQKKSPENAADRFQTRPVT